MRSFLIGCLVALTTIFFFEAEAWTQYDECDFNYEKVGCFKDQYKPNRALPNELLNERDTTNPNYDGHMIDWKDYKTSVRGLACRCAAKAKELGYKFFGLQFYGECWSGKDSEVRYNIYGEENRIKKCIASGFSECHKESKEECIGSQLTNYIYRVTEAIPAIPDVDCKCTDWEWSTCSKTCGGGTRTGKKTCTPAQGKGKPCEGPTEKPEACNRDACPTPIPDVDCKCTDWEYTTCSKTCGRGTRTGKRTCTQPQGKGKPCEGPTVELGDCNKDACPTPIPDIDCKCTDWEWTTCSKTCGGGTRTGKKTCTPPQGKGKPCEGPTEKTEACNRDACPTPIPDVDCKCTDWEYTTCSKTCGRGTRTGKRTCTQPQGKGKPCEGPTVELGDCNKDACPTPIPDIDCKCTDWEWTTCSKTCGGGTRTGKKTCTPSQGKGKPCEGPTEKPEACNRDACPTPIPDIDCNCTDWEWSACSKTCGGGTRSGKKTCTPSQGKGKPCEGPIDKSEACNEDICPVPCTKALDVGIILDGSSSVYKANFAKAKKFVAELADYFTISPSGTHFGVIVFSTNTTLEFSFSDKQYYTKESLEKRIEEVKYPRGWTRTDLALEMANDKLFSTAGGDRPDKPNLLIVFTDGKKTSKKGIRSMPYTEVIPPLKNKNVKTIAVGIGRFIHHDELQTIAMGDKNAVFMVENFDVLWKKIGPILQSSCAADAP